MNCFRLVVLFLLAPASLSKKSSSGSEVAQVAAPPPFFLQDASDGLCLAGPTFRRCDITTLYYVTGSPGTYQIHRRPVEEGEREQCLSLKNCNTDDLEKPLNIKHNKCTHCGAKDWNILGDATTGYILSTGGGERCLSRNGDETSAVSCGDTDNIIALQLNFASKEDIKAMSEEGAQMVRHARGGDNKAIKKLLKEGVDVDSSDWDKMTGLISAASAGQLSTVQLLLKEGASVDLSDKDGITPVMSACIYGHLNVLKHLVEKAGAKLEPVQGTNVSPLWLASGEGKLDIVEYLIKKGENVNEQRLDGISPLTAAVIGSHVSVVKVLMKHGADVSLVDTDGVNALTNAAEVGNVDIISMIVGDSDVNAISASGYSALVVAAAGGHAEIVKILLTHGADPNLLHLEDVTALMYGASTTSLDVVRNLVEGGADVTKRHAQGGSAVMEAATGGNLPILKFLIENGALYNDSDSDGVTTLQSAAAQGNKDIVEYLMGLEEKNNGKKGLEEWVNLYSKSGGTSIMFGAGGNNVELVQLLIDAGAKVTDVVEGAPEYLDKLASQIAAGKEDVEDHKDGITALHVAAMGGHLELTELLLKNGADVLAVDEDETSSLMGAVKGNFGDIATLLIKSGANPDDVYVDEEENKHNLLYDAIIVENNEFALLLIEHGATLSHKDDAGVTVLIQAAHRGMIDVVRALLKREGADIDAVNNEGISALIAASSEGHEEVVEMLLAAGADVTAKDTDETNSLMAAAVRGHHSLCKILLGAGADVNAQNTDGHTALMFAYNGKAQVETLWDRYGDTLRESEKEFLLVKEALHNHTETVNVITKVGNADLKLKDKEGHVAADFDYNPDVDEELVEQEKEAEKKRKRSNREL